MSLIETFPDSAEADHSFIQETPKSSDQKVGSIDVDIRSIVDSLAPAIEQRRRKYRLLGFHSEGPLYVQGGRITPDISSVLADNFRSSP